MKLKGNCPHFSDDRLGKKFISYILEKFTRSGPEGEQRYSSTLSSPLALDGVCGQCHALAASPLGITQDPLCKRLGGPKRQSEWVRKISPLPGFNLQTVPPKASHYTKYAIPLNTVNIYISFHDNKNISDYIYNAESWTNWKDLEGSCHGLTEAVSSYLHICLTRLQNTTEVSVRVVASKGRFLVGSYQTQV